MDTQKNVLTVPMAIVLAGIIIGGAVFLSRGGPAKDVFQPAAPPQSGGAASPAADITLRPVDPAEHVLGNPNAKIAMVEYSDLECPFCKSFHGTMQALVNQYGKAGSVSWVYRHFPLSIHPRSPKESQAAECAFEQGGNEKFWAYVNKIFEITPSNNGLDPAKLPQVADQIGLDTAKFQTCLDSGKFASKVQADYNDGLTAGVDGTPHTVLLLNAPAGAAVVAKLQEINQRFISQMPPGSPNVISIDSTKTKIGISGAIPFSTMKEIIDLLLK